MGNGLINTLSHHSRQFYPFMAKFFVNLANFYYTRDRKNFDHQFAVKENRIALLIGLLPSILVSLIIVVIGLTQMGITFVVPIETRWIYIICISIVIILITRSIIYRIYEKIMKGQELAIIHNNQYNRYKTINFLITFSPLILLFLIIYLVFL